MKFGKRMRTVAVILGLSGAVCACGGSKTVTGPVEVNANPLITVYTEEGRWQLKLCGLALPKNCQDSQGEPYSCRIRAREALMEVMGLNETWRPGGLVMSAGGTTSYSRRRTKAEIVNEADYVLLEKGGWYGAPREFVNIARSYKAPMVTCEVKVADEEYRVRRDATCYFGSERVNLNQYLVSEGLAVACPAEELPERPAVGSRVTRACAGYDHDYMDAEAEAKAAKRGLWAGQFDMPCTEQRGQQTKL